MVLADVSFWTVFWGVLWLFFVFMLLMIFFQIIFDLFRDHETSGVVKALWVVFLILFTPITMLIYLIVRGPGMSRRAAAQQVEAQKQLSEYIRETAGSTGSATDQIAKAKELLDAGAIDQAEFDRLKAKAIG